MQVSHLDAPRLISVIRFGGWQRRRRDGGRNRSAWQIHGRFSRLVAEPPHQLGEGGMRGGVTRKSRDLHVPRILNRVVKSLERFND
jgi:hypothetical protein